MYMGLHFKESNSVSIMVTEDTTNTRIVPKIFGGELFGMSPRSSWWSSIEDQKIVIADGVLMCCTPTEDSFVPQQIITLEELMESLKSSLGLPEDTSPEYKQQWSPRLIRRRALSEAEDNKRNANEELPRSRSFTLTPTSSPKRTRKLLRSPTEPVAPKSVLLRMAHQNASDSELSESMEKTDESLHWQGTTQDTLLSRFRSQMQWFEEKGTEYVTMETLYSLRDLLTLLTVIIEGKSPTALDFRINDDRSVTVSYQIVNNFRQNFMMLKLKSDYCLFLAPF